MSVYQKTQVLVSTSTWTPFVVPVGCNSIVFRNAATVVVNFRTNVSDATTQDSLNPGDQEVLDPAMKTVRAGSNNDVRYPSGITLAYFQAASGTGTGTVIATMYGE